MIIKTKFNIGDTVYYMQNNEIKKDVVDGVFYFNYIRAYTPAERYVYIMYEMQSISMSHTMWMNNGRENERIGEKRLFATKEELIESL